MGGKKPAGNTETTVSLVLVWVGGRHGEKVNICINTYAVRVLLIQTVAIPILPSINWFDETRSF